VAITMRTVKTQTTDRDKQALRFGVYLPKTSVAHGQLLEVKRLLAIQYGESVSYSVLIAVLLEFFLRHYRELYKKQ